MQHPPPPFYYVRETDFRVEGAEHDPRFASDVVFAGHYEPDDRLEYLEAVAAALDVNFKLFGGTWSLAEGRLGSNSGLLRLSRSALCRGTTTAAPSRVRRSRWPSCRS